MTEAQAAAVPTFEARALYKRFGGLQATDGLSLALERGRVHALIGPNGAGKTTALAQLSGELRPDEGSIHLDGRDVTALDMPARARLGIARSFQITAVFESFTVRENVALAVQSRARHHFHFFGNAARDRRLTDTADAALEQVGLADAGGHRVAALAHGQKRQLEIAMALATEPQVLLLDEPMAGMGAAESEVVASLLERLRARYAVLLIEHDMDVVFRLADTLSVLVGGRLIASGPPGEVRDDPDVQAAYLQESF
ncbi:ABC transporter ATP-binding protein [Arhodomonas aquaeolei]|uniref:ABC transporter ATP-binding protein n=1 Tax=Arhodomonas aquaeolei TaxID=2369 RepID=UPI000380FE95|nr:ABC transporter ATP-binding protein [Arhodomonas aquaeolei]